MNDKDIIVLAVIYVNNVLNLTKCILANPTDQKNWGIFFPDILDYFFDFGFGSCPHVFGLAVPGPHEISLRPSRYLSQYMSKSLTLLPVLVKS
jgi:hypothetical protein